MTKVKYVYEIAYANGVEQWNTQKHKFSESLMLETFKPYGVVRVRFHKEIPNDCHICGCGNVAKGVKDELCKECRQVYGHTYEHEL